VVIGYIEALKDGPGFCRAAARLRSRGKALVLLKVGVSDTGRDAVSSHTGGLSSDDSGYQAAFDRHGVVRARTLEELNDFARVFSLGTIRPKITAATTSGGAGVYVADLCAELGIEMSTLSAETETALGEFVPSFGRVRNPVDLTAQVVNDISILRSSLEILLGDPQTGVLLFLLSGKGTPEQSAEVIEVMTDVQSRTDKKIVLCWLGVADEVRRRGSDAGLVVYQDPARFLRPLKRYFELQASFAGSTAPVPAWPAIAPVAQLPLQPGEDGRLLLTERDAMARLQAAGVDCPRQWLVRSPRELDEAGANVTYPCVMKIVEPVVAHKSDVGGVVVGLRNAAELRTAFEGMVQRLDARVVLIAEQIPPGQEVIVGCLRDETFGMRVTLGAGGVWTNIAADAVTLVPPFDEASIRDGLSRLKLWPVLNGARGQQRYAVDALVHTVARIVQAAWEMNATLREFECNPVIVTADRAVAVDAIGFA
jgi:acetate---CoA ligase (ADP-forming)